MSHLLQSTSIAAVAVTLLVAAVPYAQDAPSARLPGNDATLRDTPGVHSALPPPLPAARGSTDADLGEHQMTGTVRELDSGTGTLVVDVEGKNVRVLFPGSALSRLEKGDQVTLSLSVRKLPANAP